MFLFLRKSFAVLAILTVSIFNAAAQTANATANPLLLAVAEKKPTPLFFTKEANIVFPELLKGNEEQSLQYIENFSNKRRDYIIRMFAKGKKMLPKAASILKKQQLPEEFKVLLTLESAYNGNVVSTAGAVGFWQIMDEVAKEYGMKYVPQLTPAARKKLLKAMGEKEGSLYLKKIDKQKDDRKNFLKSSYIAARYLKDRRINLDDNWLLMVASYNCGVGNVWSAMEKTGKTNPTFWDIKNLLPAETSAYVMNFIALNVLFHNYDKFVKKQLSFYPTTILVQDKFEQNMQEAASEANSGFK